MIQRCRVNLNAVCHPNHRDRTETAWRPAPTAPLARRPPAVRTDAAQRMAKLRVNIAESCKALAMPPFHCVFCGAYSTALNSLGLERKACPLRSCPGYGRKFNKDNTSEAK
jgi:hypothetical protein